MFWPPFIKIIYTYILPPFMCCHMEFSFLASNLTFYDLVYLTLLQCSGPSIPSDDRLLRSRGGRRHGEREIKMIYHPRIAGAHTIKKRVHAKPTLASHSSHQSRQRCSTLACSVATCPAIPQWAIRQAPRMHLSTEWDNVDISSNAVISAQYSSFSLFTSALSVSLFLPLTFYPSNIPVCLLHSFITLSLYLCLCLSLCLSLPPCLPVSCQIVLISCSALCLPLSLLVKSAKRTS